MCLSIQMSIFICPRVKKIVKKSKIYLFWDIFRKLRKIEKTEKMRKKSNFFFTVFFHRLCQLNTYIFKVHTHFGIKLPKNSRKMTSKVVILVILACFWLPKLTKLCRALSDQAVAAQTQSKCLSDIPIKISLEKLGCNSLIRLDQTIFREVLCFLKISIFTGFSYSPEFSCVFLISLNFADFSDF